MYGIDHGKGKQVDGAEACKPMWILDRGQESCVCELWWMELTTCDVRASQEEVICQIHAREIIRLPEIRIRCGGWSRQLYVKNQNDVPYGRWPETHMSGGRKA